MPRIEIGTLIDPRNEFGRGILRGLHAAVLEVDGLLWNVPPQETIARDTEEWDVDALVCPFYQFASLPAHLRSIRVQVSLGCGDERRPFVEVDDAMVGRLAAEHLLSHRLETFAGLGFRFSTFSRRRLEAFRQTVEAAGGRYIPDLAELTPSDAGLNPKRPNTATFKQFLTEVPRPCGIFAACDGWATLAMRHCRRRGVRIPEEIQIIAADNDEFVCTLMDPPLSSVAIPWEQMGYHAGRMALQHIDGDRTEKRRFIAPTAVVPRRSTDAVPLPDPDVARVLRTIREEASKGAGVEQIAHGIRSSRRSLERRFRTLVGRTMGQQLRRERVEVARRLIMHTDLSMFQIAVRSGFSSQAKLSEAFRRELGIRPRDIRKQTRMR